MNSVEALLSNAEREFLARHQITASQVVDARGLSKQARNNLMRSRAAVLAIASPCEKQGLKGWRGWWGLMTVHPLLANQI